MRNSITPACFYERKTVKVRCFIAPPARHLCWRLLAARSKMLTHFPAVANIPHAARPASMLAFAGGAIENAHAFSRRCQYTTRRPPGIYAGVCRRRDRKCSRIFPPLPIYHTPPIRHLCWRLPAARSKMLTHFPAVANIPHAAHPASMLAFAGGAIENAHAFSRRCQYTTRRPPGIYAGVCRRRDRKCSRIFPPLPIYHTPPDRHLCWRLPAARSKMLTHFPTLANIPQRRPASMLAFAGGAMKNAVAFFPDNIIS